MTTRGVSRPRAAERITATLRITRHRARSIAGIRAEGTSKFARIVAFGPPSMLAAPGPRGSPRRHVHCEMMPPDSPPERRFPLPSGTEKPLGMMPR